MTNSNPPADQTLENKKEACKTFIEQTKQLTTLASAFIVAPVAAQTFLQLAIDMRIFFAELAFIVSVLSSYIVLGSIAGSQARGDFDVYRPATMLWGNIQFFSYLGGLILFVWWLINRPAAAI